MKIFEQNFLATISIFCCIFGTFVPILSSLSWYYCQLQSRVNVDIRYCVWDFLDVHMGICQL